MIEKGLGCVKAGRGGGADKNRCYLTRAKILPSVRHVSGVRDALPLAAGVLSSVQGMGLPAGGGKYSL